jgi:hypothetical protein
MRVKCSKFYKAHSKNLKPDSKLVPTPTTHKFADDQITYSQTITPTVAPGESCVLYQVITTIERESGQAVVLKGPCVRAASLPTIKGELSYAWTDPAIGL